MTLETLLDQFPTYAQDVRLNLSSSLQQSELSPAQIWGTAVACSVATGNKLLTDAITEEAAKQVEATVLDAARGAASIMGVNNIYYRFCHLTGNHELSKQPARLRMNIMRSHGAPATDFEIWSLAVSAIHGCGVCIESHYRLLKEKGATDPMVLSAVRIAASIHAAGVLLSSGVAGTPA